MCLPEQDAFEDLPGVGCWLGWVLGLCLCWRVSPDAAIAGHLQETETRMRREKATWHGDEHRGGTRSRGQGELPGRGDISAEI